MNVCGRVVATLLTIGLLFTALALTRGRVDGAAVIATASLLLALFTTVWASINRKRNHS